MTVQLIVFNMITFLYSLKMSKLDCNRSGIRLNKKICGGERERERDESWKKYDYKSYNNFADNPTGSDDDHVEAVSYMTSSSRFLKATWQLERQTFAR